MDELTTSASSANAIEAAIRARRERGTVTRLYYFTFLLFFSFTAYGFASHAFLRVYRPGLTLFDNVWPRLLGNSLPALALALFLKRSRVPDRWKIWIWLVLSLLIYDVACMVNVWPIAWAGDASVMLQVTVSNTSFVTGIALMLAPAPLEALLALGVIGTLFWAPLFIVTARAGDHIILTSTLNDTVFYGLTALLAGYSMRRERDRLFRLEIEKELEASKFLGPVVSKAIFEQKTEMLEMRRRHGYVINLDVRDSTEHQKRHGQAWLAFRAEYFAAVARHIKQFGGYIQKTMGDGHVLNFGVVDDVDLSDLPGIEEELAKANDRRLKQCCDNALKCLAMIFESFTELSGRHFPSEEFRLAGGIDRGHVQCGTHGDADHLEFDVNGEPVNCSARLQEYAKVLATERSLDSSLLVISPYTADYVDDLTAYARIATDGHPIRNYPQIRWVLVREFRRTAKSKPPMRRAA